MNVSRFCVWPAGAVLARHGSRARHILLPGACAALLIAVASAPVLAQQDPLAGRNRFPEFRNLSGLAGGGYGVDSDGRLSLSGPTALSTPVAHVLGRDHFWILGEKTSLHNTPEINNSWTNGTFCLAYGHTFGQFNVAVSDTVLSGYGNQAINLQAQYIPLPSMRLVGSIGVQDIRGGGGSSGTNVPGDNVKSTSYFGVVTYRFDACKAPLYVSAGIGTRRFRQGFLSASYRVLPPMRVWVEHDGFGPNFGALLTWLITRRGDGPEANVRAGLIQRRYVTLGVGLGF